MRNDAQGHHGVNFPDSFVLGGHATGIFNVN